MRVESTDWLWEISPPSDAVLIAPEEVRDWPEQGISVLMIADNPYWLMFQRLVLGNPDGVRTYDTIADLAGARREVLAQPEKWDLITILHPFEEISAFEFCAELIRSLEAIPASRRPRLVLLAVKVDAKTAAECNRTGIFAAWATAPLSEYRLRELMRSLFRAL